MKYFKDLEAFEKRLQKSAAWDDYFMLGGRLYQIYEYGGGFGKHDKSYVYFVNKRTRDMINVEYFLPSVNYMNGERIEKGSYRLVGVWFLPKNALWRPIV